MPPSRAKTKAVIPVESAPSPSGERFSAAAGEHFVAQGPVAFRVAAGKVDACGAELPVGKSCSVPAGYRLPLSALAKTELSVLSGSVEAFGKVPVSSVPEAVAKAAAGLRDARTILVVGGIDAGKSFFCTYLANRFFAAGRRVSVIDLDLGQSDVGPPYSVGLVALNDPAPVLSALPASALYFVGGTGSPAGREATVLEGLRRALVKARSEKDPDHVIINTPGWIDGPGGLAFQKAVYEAAAPDRLVALQRGKEAEPATAWAPPDSVLRLASPPAAASVSTEQRTAYRRELVRRYYAARRLLVLPFQHVRTERGLFLSGQPQRTVLEKILYAELLRDRDREVLVAVREPLNAEEVDKARREYGAVRLRQFTAGSEAHLQVGLANAAGDTLALGAVRRFDFANQFMEFWTPLPVGKENQVKLVQFGGLRVTTDGEELGPAEGEGF
jgi:polynucleotide 5'-hydroxyl-kinase GRC3/NOL9